MTKRTKQLQMEARQGSFMLPLRGGVDKATRGSDAVTRQVDSSADDWRKEIYDKLVREGYTTPDSKK